MAVIGRCNLDDAPAPLTWMAIADAIVNRGRPELIALASVGSSAISKLVADSSKNDNGMHLWGDAALALADSSVGTTLASRGTSDKAAVLVARQ